MRGVLLALLYVAAVLQIANAAIAANAVHAQPDNGKRSLLGTDAAQAVTTVSAANKADKVDTTQAATKADWRGRGFNPQWGGGSFSAAQAQAQAQSQGWGGWGGAGSQAQAQAQAQSFGGGWGGGSGAQAQAQAQSQSLGGGWGGSLSQAQAQAQAQSFGSGGGTPFFGGYGRPWGKKLLEVFSSKADTSEAVDISADGASRKLQGTTTASNARWGGLGRSNCGWGGCNRFWGGGNSWSQASANAASGSGGWGGNSWSQANANAASGSGGWGGNSWSQASASAASGSGGWGGNSWSQAAASASAGSGSGWGRKLMGTDSVQKVESAKWGGGGGFWNRPTGGWGGFNPKWGWGGNHGPRQVPVLLLVRADGVATPGPRQQPVHLQAAAAVSAVGAVS